MWYDSEGNEIESSSSYYDEDGTYYNYSTYSDDDDYSSYYSYGDDDYDTSSYTYYSSYPSTSTATTTTTMDLGSLFGTIFAIGATMWIIVIAVTILILVSQWKIFTKAKQHGYAALIPIHNKVITYEVAKLPGWYFFLSLIPFVNIYIAFKTNICLAKQFGKGAGFGVLMVFFPFVCMPILAFSKAEYNGGVGSGTSTTPTGSVDPVAQAASTAPAPITPTGMTPNGSTPTSGPTSAI